MTKSLRVTQPRHAQIPYWIIEHPKVGGPELAVLVIIIRHADWATNDNSFPSHKTIAAKLNRSVSHVKTALRNLEDIGLLIVEHRPGQSSLYSLDITEGGSQIVATPQSNSDGLVSQIVTTNKRPFNKRPLTRQDSAARTTAMDSFKDAYVNALNIKPSKALWGQIQAMASDLVDQEADPAMMPMALAKYRKQFPDREWPPSPVAMAKWWPMLWGPDGAEVDSMIGALENDATWVAVQKRRKAAGRSYEEWDTKQIGEQ